jgi:hypothetical protein
MDFFPLFRPKAWGVAPRGSTEYIWEFVANHLARSSSAMTRALREVMRYPPHEFEEGFCPLLPPLSFDRKGHRQLNAATLAIAEYVSIERPKIDEVCLM